MGREVRYTALLTAAPLLLAGYAACVQAGETTMTTVRVASGLSNPLFVTHAPEDFGRVFILEQLGRIRILKNGELLPTPFLDITSLVVTGGERGLLGLAFHPDYSKNGYFFVNYTTPTKDGVDTVVARYQVTENPDLANANSALTLLRLVQPRGTHNGGWMSFGPDGYLYIATGDGGRDILPNNAQDLTDNLLGKILRVDINSDDWPEDDLRNYGIPPGNPFVGLEGDDEIWAYGMRNPWRCAFDSLTADLYITDVGENTWEEINFMPSDAGDAYNFGWRCTEGPDCFNPDDCTCLTPAMVAPLYAYEHLNRRCSISGGEVYRGCMIDGMDGMYFFADWCTGEIWTLEHIGLAEPVVVDRTSELAPAGTLDIRRPTSFGRDRFGELYICDWIDGEIFKIVPANPTAPVAVMDSDPPHGAIDARQPSEPDGSDPRGWNSFRIDFDGCVDGVASGDFHIGVEGGVLPLPTVENVDAVASNAVVVTLDRPIDVGAWTTLTHTPSGTFIRVGALPGDVNADGASNSTDVTALTDALSGTLKPLFPWSIDIDRSGRVAPCDILRLIDLLNGADAYEVFNGASLP